MTAIALDHINIVAPAALLAQVRDFYCQLLALTPGPRPAFRRPGYWLYANGQALLHLTEDTRQGSATGHLDHVAFACVDLAATRQRLAALGQHYTEDVSTGQEQLFLRDPTGLTIELNFARESA